ncbi:LOW QUALITY PROTEIN: uncharacterized protein EMH_0042670 [Eimeria mitis]|uniref:Uncharacterized protein n=1 Tax=Eimeria mitis TaxID=44415 RepID=U6JT60_9EIME|nr:LOW QUALITY PROTEIN: uncharacterized protein EMH_0042670 [Eimeria mitis]CDJ28645.1 hypothetical protein, conserved [Eimeria mitis]
MSSLSATPPAGVAAAGAASPAAAEMGAAFTAPRSRASTVENCLMEEYNIKKSKKGRESRTSSKSGGQGGGGVRARQRKGRALRRQTSTAGAAVVDFLRWSFVLDVEPLRDAVPEGADNLRLPVGNDAFVTVLEQGINFLFWESGQKRTYFSTEGRIPGYQKDLATRSTVVLTPP